MRWRIDLAYDGTDFHGWAAQPGLRTVQGELETWIPRVLRLAEPVHLVVAGRTDAGVHARGQVCHMDLDVSEAVTEVLPRRLARVLDEDLAVRAVSPAPDGFDARFSAIWRRYTYRVADRHPDPLSRRFIARSRHPLDVGVLNAAADLVIGLRDFAPFCKPRSGATTIRDLKRVEAHRCPQGVVEITLLADAFCHSMVRSLVGALTAVAGGKRSMAWLEEVLHSSHRHPEVTVMPARGLTLEEVGYPGPEGLAARARTARATRTLEES